MRGAPRALVPPWLRACTCTLVGCWACAPAAYEGPSPEARLDRVVRAAQQGDSQALRELVEALDSDDAAVRLAAIVALERLSDRSFGYRHEQPAALREDAVRRWVEAVSAGGAAHETEPEAQPDG